MDPDYKAGLAIAAAAAVGALVLGPGGGLARLTDGPVQGGVVAAMADKWGRVFGVPSSWILAIAKVESGLRPAARSASTARDELRGGAWGAMQVTLRTAAGLAAELAKNTDRTVALTFAKWNGTGAALQDADVGVMFGAYLLSKLARQFGPDFSKVAAAYNQGPGTVSKLIAANNWPAGLTAHGRDYVTKTSEALA